MYCMHCYQLPNLQACSTSLTNLLHVLGKDWRDELVHGPASSVGQQSEQQPAQLALEAPLEAPFDTQHIAMDTAPEDPGLLSSATEPATEPLCLPESVLQAWRAQCASAIQEQKERSSRREVLEARIDEKRESVVQAFVSSHGAFVEAVASQEADQKPKLLCLECNTAHSIGIFCDACARTLCVACDKRVHVGNAAHDRNACTGSGAQWPLQHLQTISIDSCGAAIPVELDAQESRLVDN